MNRDQIRSTVLEALHAVAPEADPAALRADQPLRDQLEIDSFDFLNFIVGIDKALHVSIPESDYPKLTSLNSFVEYLAAKGAEA